MKSSGFKLDGDTTLVCCALLSEAQPLIQALELRQYETRPYKLFRKPGSDVVLLISGVGGAMLRKALDWLRVQVRVQRAVLVGTAASLDPGIEAGTAFCAAEVDRKLTSGFCSSEAVRLPAAGLGSGLLPGVRLVSLEKPYIKDPAVLPQSTLVDMEAWHFVQYWREFLDTEDIAVIKIVSDQGCDRIPSREETRHIMELQLERWLAMLRQLAVEVQDNS